MLLRGCWPPHPAKRAPTPRQAGQGGSHPRDTPQSPGLGSQVWEPPDWGADGGSGWVSSSAAGKARSEVPFAHGGLACQAYLAHLP